MSLTGALHIGRTGLTASQLGIQVAGNNMANASTPGYSRQIARLSPIPGAGNVPQISIGSGVAVRSIERQVDQALQQRLWSTGSDQAGADLLANIYSQLEAILGELGDNDLSTELTSFLSSWSERANQTKSSAAVVQQGEKLAGFIRRVRQDLASQSGQAEQQMAALVANANGLIDNIARLNQAIGDAEVGGQPANVLRDQRDQLITQLSEIMPVNVVDRGREGTDVLVGSIPIVLGARARPLELKRTANADGGIDVRVATQLDGSVLDIPSGTLGALLSSRDDVVTRVVGGLDTLSSQLIWEVNRLHSTGTRAEGYTGLTGELRMATADRSRPINAASNEAFAGLPFQPVNGGFTIRVRQGASDTVQVRRIDVDLDGLTAQNQPATPLTNDDTSVEQIVQALDAVQGISARFNAQGQVEVTADEGFSFSFEDDTSGVLAALGVNRFFSGTDAKSIGVRSDLLSTPSMLAAGRWVNDTLVENGNALQLAQLQNKPIAALDGRSIGGLWRDTVQDLATRTAGAKSAAQAAGVVRDSLLAQVQAVSGVSIDEESINLLQYQRQYQASARLISVVDETTQQLLSLI